MFFSIFQAIISIFNFNPFVFFSYLEPEEPTSETGSENSCVEDSCDEDYVESVSSSASESESDCNSGRSSPMEPLLKNEVTAAEHNKEGNEDGSNQRVSSEEEEDDDSEVDESTIMRSCDQKDVYVTKVLKSSTNKHGNKKKNPRVYNSRHFCILCKTHTKDFAQHIRGTGHSKFPEIMELDGKTAAQRKRLISLLRMKGDHENNLQTMTKCKGELILGRRLQEDDIFECRLFGPCPTCLEWMRITTLPRHKCIGKEVDGTHLTKGQLETQSQVLAGHITCNPSQCLLREVFPIIRTDQIGILAKADHMIVMLGNRWMEKNISNRLMRKTYTSAVMRLLSRLLLEIRKLVTPPEGWDLYDYIAPQYLQQIVKAACIVCKPDADDTTDMKSPSNGIKLSHYVKQVATMKYAHAIKNGNKKKRQDAKDFLKLAEVEWSTIVQRTLLSDRKREKRTPLPLPSDVKKLSEYLVTECGQQDIELRNAANFKRINLLVQAYLITYNRRRPGEVQALRYVLTVKLIVFVDVFSSSFFLTTDQKHRCQRSRG